MDWSTESEIVQGAKELLEDLKSEVNHGKQGRYEPRQQAVLGGHALIAQVTSIEDDNRRFIKRPFFAAISILEILKDGPSSEQKIDVFLSYDVVPLHLRIFDVYPWTSWIGDLYTRLINQGYPEKASYGPDGRSEPRPVGSLTHFTIKDGMITQHTFQPLACDYIASEQRQIDVGISDGNKEFALKDIIRTLDLDQNDQIRGPMEGIVIITGGPGVGKTTVALHRIPYLINEQPTHGQTDEIKRHTNRHFTAEKTLIIVWKPHLVEYLHKTMEQLGVRLPEANCIQIDDWIRKEAHRLLPIGIGQFRIDDALNDDLFSLFTENDLQQFVSSDVAFIDKLRKTAIRYGISIRECFDKHGSRMKFHASDDDRLMFNGNSIDRFVADTKKQASRASMHLNGIPSEVEKNLSKLELALYNDHLLRHIDVYFDFLLSDMVRQTIVNKHGDNSAIEFQTRIRSDQNRKLIQSAGLPLILWIIKRSTDHLPRGDLRRLLSYTHIVVDEAQYFSPIVFRLLRECSGLPKGTMTIVGDVEQKISVTGGITEWIEFGLTEDELSNIFKLETNYRWSKNVFKFLQTFQISQEIKESVSKPRLWYSGEGHDVKLVNRDSIKELIAHVVTEVSALRKLDDFNYQTIAVITPYRRDDSFNVELQSTLEKYAISARWVGGQDVRESINQVVLTNYESIVGLEFDAVFVVSPENMVEQYGPEGILAVWVAITRAKRFLNILTHSAPTFLASNAFDEYRV